MFNLVERLRVISNKTLRTVLHTQQLTYKIMIELSLLPYYQALDDEVRSFPTLFSCMHNRTSSRPINLQHSLQITASKWKILLRMAHKTIITQAVNGALNQAPGRYLLKFALSYVHVCVCVSTS